MLKLITAFSFFVLMPGSRAHAAPDHVETVRSEDGWRLLVNKKPYFVKGLIYAPIAIGESPNDGSQRDWMMVDDDGDGRNDYAFKPG